MLYYIFSRTNARLSKWELMETLESRQAAMQVLKNYKQLMGSQKAIAKEVLMIEAESEAEARARLTDLLVYSAKIN